MASPQGTTKQCWTNEDSMKGSLPVKKGPKGVTIFPGTRDCLLTELRKPRISRIPLEYSFRKKRLRLPPSHRRIDTVACPDRHALRSLAYDVTVDAPSGHQYRKQPRSRQVTLSFTDFSLECTSFGSWGLRRGYMSRRGQVGLLILLEVTLWNRSKEPSRQFAGLSRWLFRSVPGQSS